MFPFFGQKKIASEKNGEIVLKYGFGETEVFVDGYHQSTAYVEIMWEEALKRLPTSFSAKRVLMLGLGGGCAIQSIQRRFLHCDVTVIEWDPEMIAIYKHLHPNQRPIVILQGDAIALVPAMNETFDLVLVDLFKGNVTPSALASDTMIDAIARIVDMNGYCLLNAFVSLDLPAFFDRHFRQIDQWTYSFNRLLLYRRRSL